VRCSPANSETKTEYSVFPKILFTEDQLIVISQNLDEFKFSLAEIETTSVEISAIVGKKTFQIRANLSKSERNKIKEHHINRKWQEFRFRLILSNKSKNNIKTISDVKYNILKF
jgi:hypothetical protein